MLNFRNLELCPVSDLYRHAILLRCAKLYWNRTMGCWVMTKNDFFKNGGRSPSWILKISHLVTWLSPNYNMHLCTKFHQNEMIFHWNMAISRFSRWLISATLNFRGPIMGFLKSPFGTSYSSSIETIALNCLLFEKSRFLLATDRQTDKQTYGQNQCIKALSLSRVTSS